MRAEDPRAAGLQPTPRGQPRPVDRRRRVPLQEALQGLSAPLILALDDAGEVEMHIEESNEHSPVWASLA